jgi:hypothetical protein
MIGAWHPHVKSLIFIKLILEQILMTSYIQNTEIVSLTSLVVMLLFHSYDLLMAFDLSQRVKVKVAPIVSLHSKTKNWHDPDLLIIMKMWE